MNSLLGILLITYSKHHFNSSLLMVLNQLLRIHQSHRNQAYSDRCLHYITDFIHVVDHQDMFLSKTLQILIFCTHCYLIQYSILVQHKNFLNLAVSFLRRIRWFGLKLHNTMGHIQISSLMQEELHSVHP